MADHRWSGLTAVGKVVRVREMTDKTTTETAYYLLSTAMAAERFGEVVRSHWAVENRLHWCLDVTMNEDQARNRMDHSPQNLGILRHMALNLVRKESSRDRCEKSSGLLERHLPGHGAGSTLKCDYPAGHHRASM
jgi:predicted transposase YbfD/YdcC